LPIDVFLLLERKQLSTQDSEEVTNTPIEKGIISSIKTIPIVLHDLSEQTEDGFICIGALLIRKLGEIGSPPTPISLLRLFMRECQKGSGLWRQGRTMIHPKTEAKAAELMSVSGEKVSASSNILQIDDKVTIGDWDTLLSVFRQSTPYP